jgi:hypothetical protein
MQCQDPGRGVHRYNKRIRKIIDSKKIISLAGGLAVIERGVRGCRAGTDHPGFKIISESEAPQASEILPRRGKMSVPAKAQTRQPLNLI